MEITTLCTVIAALRILPNRSQFFQYESVSLSCGLQGNWSVMRNTSTYINQECFSFWPKINESDCFTDTIYPSDTGVYWCESAAGECSDAVNITVTAGSVILESPVLPVMEGHDVTLLCTNMTTSSSSSLTADFYKDGRLFRSSSTGNLTIHSVSKSDEGLYKCEIPGAGRSPDSWLTVRAGRLDSSNSPGPAPLLLPVVVVCILLVSLVSVMLLCLWRNDKGGADISYTDVTILQEASPKRTRDMDAVPTVYSTINLGNT